MSSEVQWEVLQIDRLRLTNLMQYRFKKICSESEDITKNVSRIGLPNQTSKI